jgi:hypothetical protein
MAYPYDMYAEILKKELGKKYLDREESNYFLNFADSSIMSSSKKIYYHALFYYKRFYPRILIHLIIKYKVKKALKNENAPQTIQNLYKQIAEIIYLSAMGGYAKNKDVKKLINKYFI